MAKRRPWPPPRMPRLLAPSSEICRPAMLSSFFCSSAWICCCVRSRWCQSARETIDHGAVGAAVADGAEDVRHLAGLLVGRQRLLDARRQLRHVVEVGALLRREADLDDAAILGRRDLLLQGLEGDEAEDAEAEADGDDDPAQPEARLDDPHVEVGQPRTDAAHQAACRRAPPRRCRTSKPASGRR